MDVKLLCAFAAVGVLASVAALGAAEANRGGLPVAEGALLIRQWWPELVGPILLVAQPQDVLRIIRIALAHKATHREAKDAAQHRRTVISTTGRAHHWMLPRLVGE